MPKRFCIGCKKLFDRALTGTMRCPACQASADRKRNARPNTTARGYGAQHQALRSQLLEAFRPGQACARCGRPIASKDDADLGHADGQDGYRGLEHRRCNRGAPSRARKGKR